MTHRDCLACLQILGNGNSNLTVTNNTVIFDIPGETAIMAQGFTQTANISFNTLIANTVRISSSCAHIIITCA